jgi:hypothetical protein
MKKNGSKQARSRAERTQLTSARKAAAPHGHPLTRSKPEDRVHPAERKAKHKRRPGDPD